MADDANNVSPEQLVESKEVEAAAREQAKEQQGGGDGGGGGGEVERETERTGEAAKEGGETSSHHGGGNIAAAADPARQVETSNDNNNDVTTSPADPPAGSGGPNPSGGDGQSDGQSDTQNGVTPQAALSDETVVSTDIVIVGGDAPATLEPWGKEGTGLRTLHKSEDLTPQHEACLFEAAYTDNVSLAQQMIDLKVNVNCKRQRGRTPLHYCALGNGALVARLLAFHKADLTQPDDDGLTPEQLGRSVGNSVSFLIDDAVRAEAVSR